MIMSGPIVLLDVPHIDLKFLSLIQESKSPVWQTDQILFFRFFFIVQLMSVLQMIPQDGKKNEKLTNSELLI